MRGLSRFLSITLVSVLLLTLLPTAALAASTLKIVWNANGGKIGTKSMITTKVVSGKKIGKLPTTPKRTGYTLKGWYTKKAGGIKVTTASKPKKSSTYYAQWTAKKYTLTFNANGGSVGTASKKVTLKKAYGTLPTPTRSGYSFDGWYTAVNGGTKVSATTIMPAKNVTVYAHWKNGLNENTDPKWVGHWYDNNLDTNMEWEYWHLYLNRDGTFTYFLVTTAEYSYKGNYSVSDGKIYFKNVIFTNDDYKENKPDSYVDYVFANDSNGKEQLRLSNTGASFTGSTWWYRAE